MIKTIFYSRWAKATIIVLLIIVVIILFARQEPKDKPSLIETSPQDSQESVSPSTKIILIFDKPINKDQLTIGLEPIFEYQLQEQEKELIISPNLPLEPGQTYTLHLQYGKDWQKTIAFTTAQIDPGLNLEGIGDPKIADEMDQYKQENYPLFEATPKRTANWTVDYLAPRKLVVNYKKEIDLETIQEEVFSWVEGFGLGKDSHEYIWEIE